MDNNRIGDAIFAFVVLLAAFLFVGDYDIHCAILDYINRH